MQRGRVACVLVAALALGGCAAPPAHDARPSQAEVLLTIERALANGHDHSDPALHLGASYRATEVWRSDLSDDGAPRTPVTELDIGAGHAFVATTNPVSGMAIFDLADPSRPVLVGRHDGGVAFVADAKVTRDGRWAFLGTQPEGLWGAAFGGAPSLADGALSAGGPIGIGDFGVQIVDVSDPSAPRLAGLYATSDEWGYHMLELDERESGLTVYGAALGTGRMDILRFEETPTPRLVPLGFYQSPEALDPRNNVMAPGGIDGLAHTVHDMTLVEDPLDGYPLLIVDYWHGGLHFLDATDPARPRFLGKWDAFTELGSGAAEYARVTEVDGRRIAVIGSGHKLAERQGVVWIVDATDLPSPQLLGTWSLPGFFPTTEPLIYTTHAFEVEDNKVYLSHYHAGAYVLDIGTLEKAAHPEVLAFHVPAGVDPVTFVAIRPTPLLFDAVPYAGRLYLTDSTGGLRVVELAPEAQPR